MKDFPIAIQLYSVRDDMAADFEGTLKKVKELGYDGVEFAGIFGKSAAEVKALCEKYELAPISAHVPFVDMMKDPSILETYKEIGCEFIVIPYLTEEYRPGNKKFQEVIKGARMLGEKANALGLTLAYHNHDFEFVKLDGKYALDILYSEVPADLLETEIDTCWANVGGVDPAEYILQYNGRTHIVHLKDFVGEKGENMYALIGIDDGEQKPAEDTPFELRPVGYGKQDFAKILSACKTVGANWVVVEQDNPSMGKTPMECAELSINYLKNL